MRRTLFLVSLAALAMACGDGKDTDTGLEETEDTVIGDGMTPVIISGYYWCAADTNGNNFYFFSVEVEDEQGPDTIDWKADLWFMDGDDYLFGEEAPLPLQCQSDTSPRYCQGSILESDEFTGPCATATWTYQAEVEDEDGNVSERYTEFIVNPNPPA